MPEAGCWLWTGPTDPGGYGQIGHAGRAHRRSWITSNGDIPRGLHVLHRCDVPGCVNPDHLFLGTPKDNAQDREAKGRRRKLLGEDHGMAELSRDEVVEIRFRYAQGGTSQRSLAAKYNVCQATIFYVLKKITWTEV